MTLCVPISFTFSVQSMFWMPETVFRHPTKVWSRTGCLEQLVEGRSGGRSAPKTKKAFDRGGPAWPPRSNAKDDRSEGGSRGQRPPAKIGVILKNFRILFAKFDLRR